MKNAMKEVRIWDKNGDPVHIGIAELEIDKEDFLIKSNNCDVLIPIKELISAIAEILYEEGDQHNFAITILDYHGITPDLSSRIKEKFPMLRQHTRNTIFSVCTALIRDRDVKTRGVKRYD